MEKKGTTNVCEQVKEDVTMLKKNIALENRVKELEKENLALKRDCEILNDTITAYKTSGEDMGQEITSLKRSICGFKASNKKYKEQYQKDSLELIEIKETLEEKESVISGLEDQIHSLKKTCDEYKERIKNISEEKCVLLANYKYVCELPWYKRIFYKG